MEQSFPTNARQAAERRESLQRAADSLAEAQHRRSASGLVEQVAGQIREFEASLDDAHDLAILLNGNITLVLQQIGFHDPGLILFIGRDPHGQPLRVLQHINQLNVALIGVARDKSAGPRKPIGFDLPS